MVTTHTPQAAACSPARRASGSYCEHRFPFPMSSSTPGAINAMIATACNRNPLIRTKSIIKVCMHTATSRKHAVGRPFQLPSLLVGLQESCHCNHQHNKHHCVHQRHHHRTCRIIMRALLLQMSPLVPPTTSSNAVWILMPSICLAFRGGPSWGHSW